MGMVNLLISIELIFMLQWVILFFDVAPLIFKGKGSSGYRCH
jgi:hypothetical protein